MSDGGGLVSTDGPLPQLVYADEAKSFLDSLESENLVVYVGVLPYLKRAAYKDGVENSVPFAFGHSLYLDIDQGAGAA
jgi:hypothetical protein